MPGINAQQDLPLRGMPAGQVLLQGMPTQLLGCAQARLQASHLKSHSVCTPASAPFQDASLWLYNVGVTMLVPSSVPALMHVYLIVRRGVMFVLQSARECVC